MEFVNRRVEFFQDLEPGRGDAGLDDPAIFGLTLARNQGALFHAIEKTGHVRIAGDHAVTDPLAGKAIESSATQNTKDVVLGGCEAMGLDEEVGILGEAIGGTDQSDEEFSFGTRR